MVETGHLSRSRPTRLHPYFDGAPSPIAISHSGDTDSGARAGSRDAYRLAYENGFRWFQVDVVLIGGDQLVSAHTVFGRRRAWENLSIEEVSASAGHEVSLLSDLLDEFDDVKFNVETKSRCTESALRSLFARPGVLERVCLSTPFHRRLSRRFRHEYGDDVCLAAPLIDGGLIGVELVPFRRVRHDVCQVWLPLARSRRVVERALRRGMRFQVWTANSVKAIDHCLHLGVSGIITDRHKLLRQRLRDTGRWSR